MYKYQSKQIGLSDFDMPYGVELDPNNRWVKKAENIPWEEIETKYAELFPSNTGNVAKPLRLALGALIIATERRLSDEEVPLQIQETPCLQYFCGLKGFTNELPFDSSSMVHFRKRLTPEILGEINEMIIAKATRGNINEETESESVAAANGEATENKGDLILDATCAPQKIRYPQDLSLLNEARENLEKMIDSLHDSGTEIKPRTYRKVARRDFLSAAMKRKKSSEEVREAVRKQLDYVYRDLGYIEKYLNSGKILSEKQNKRLGVIYRLYDQQVYMYNNQTHHVDDRIVSISQPWIRPIVRGKVKDRCEFGAKLDISVSNGFTRLEHTSFDAYNESENLQAAVERYKERTGHYPERVLGDRIYRTSANINYCKGHNIRLIGKPLGRPKKDVSYDKKQLHKDEADRIEVERKFSQAKGSFGLGLIRTRLETTSLTTISLSILALNIAYLWRLIFFYASFML